VTPDNADQWTRPPAGAGYGPAAAAAQQADHTVDLAGLPECKTHDGETRDGESRRLLVGQTARFAANFVRWMEGRTCDGLSYSRLRLLQALHCSGPAIMRDLGEQLGATPRNMTALVDALEEAQLVVRRPHPTDRRATLIELSEAGTQAADQALEPSLDAMAELFSSLSAAERQQFSALIVKLTRAMEPGQGKC
jgi:DNA-binding MarR family transcriptional regulator